MRATVSKDGMIKVWAFFHVMLMPPVRHDWKVERVMLSTFLISVPAHADR